MLGYNTISHDYLLQNFSLNLQILSHFPDVHNNANQSVYDFLFDVFVLSAAYSLIIKQRLQLMCPQRLQQHRQQRQKQVCAVHVVVVLFCFVLLSPVSIQTQSLALASSQSWLPLLRPSIPIGWRLRKTPANRNARSKQWQPWLAACQRKRLPTQALAFLAVFVYATHATQAIAFEWKPSFTVAMRHDRVQTSENASSLASQFNSGSLKIKSLVPNPFQWK